MIIAYPSMVEEQATAPTITSGSLLWRDTDDNTLYFSDGSSWKAFSSTSDSAGYEQMISEVILELLRISAEGTLTAPDYNGMYLDYFSDDTGYDNTIDTGNTDANFETNEYNNKTYTPNTPTELNPSSYSSSNTDTGVTEKRGFKFTCNTDCWLKSCFTIRGTDSNSPNKAYLLASDGTTILDSTTDANAETRLTVSGTRYDFAGNYKLEAGNDYWIKTDRQGSAYHDTYATSGFSYSNSYVNVTQSNRSSTSQPSNTRGIDVYTDSSESGADNLNVQTSPQSIPFVPSYVLIHVKDKTLVGTGSITYDIYFDGGTTPDSTGNTLDTKIPVTDGTGKSMVVKFNLNGTGLGNNAKIKDYEVLLWSS